MGFFDSLFGSKKTTVTQQPLIPDWQLQTGKDLSAWVQQYLPQYKPGAGYTGKFTADMTDPEKMGLNRLTDYLKNPGTGELFDAAKQQTLDTIGGKYADAASNPFIQSMIALSKQTLGDSINDSRARAGARGNYFSSRAIGDENLIRERVQNALNTQVGDVLNQERGRQYDAVSKASALDEYKNQTVPLHAINASQTYGSLARTIEQADLEARYNDFINQRKELSAIPSQAQGVYGTSVPYGIPSLTTKSPSTFMKILGEAEPVVGSYNTAKYGYDKNQASVGDSLKALMKIISAGGY